MRTWRPFLRLLHRKGPVIFLWIATMITHLSLAEEQPPLFDIKQWYTKSGTHVLYLHQPELPLVDIHIAFEAGSARDGNTPGLAYLTSNMLNQGSASLSADDIAQQFDEVGALFNTSVDRDMTLVQLRSLTEANYLKPAIQTLLKVLGDPNFPTTALERERQRQQQLILHNQELPSTVAKENFYQQLFPGHPYGHPVIGKQDSVAKLTQSQVQQFYQHYYLADKAVLSIVGNIDESLARNLSEQLTRVLPTGEAAAPIVMAKPNDKATLTQIPFASTQTTIMLGQVGINHQHPDYFPLMVGNYILGGTGLTSLLFDEIREQQGLAYAVYSSLHPLAANGPFTVTLGTENAQAKKALQLTLATLQSFIRQGPSQQALQAAKDYLTGNFYVGLDNNLALATTLVRMGFYKLPLNYLDTYRQRIYEVNEKAVQRAFNKLINPENVVVVLVGADPHEANLPQ